MIIEIENKLQHFLKNDENVVFAVIFGSYASGKHKKGSDIDVGIFFRKPPEGLELFNFINRLSDLIDKDVDIVVLNKASAFIRHQIMKNKIVLVVKDRTIYRLFREKTISDYDEYKYISGMNAYAR